MGNLVQKIISSCPCGKKVVAENRNIHVGNKVPPGVEVEFPEKYPNNRVISSKYTAINFIPKNLFEQFHRIANFYFLCVAMTELVIDSPVSPITTILPLIFVVLTTAIKQGYEDWLRHKADKEVNHRNAHVVRDGETVTVKSMEIEVGDIVKVSVNQAIPCDLVMLSSEDPEGKCFITTANLDGETNLKTFRCVPDTRHLTSDSAFTEFRGTIECQQPITDLYRFIGCLDVYEEGGTNSIRHALAADNVLLRGCRLKNTPFVYGCAVYTGQQTKISLNSKYKSAKFSRVERRMNTFLIVFLVVLAVYSAIWVGLKAWFYSQDLHSHEAMWYTEPQEEWSFVRVLEEFLAFMVLCNYIIPISMYVTIELQKFFGSMFFAWDLEMYDAQMNEPAKALTSDLNEELGQVEYLFTDKTGTLTENDMQFRQCSVNGNKYVEVGGMLCEMPDIPGVQPQPIARLTPDVEELFKVLALCHTVRVDRKDNLGTYSTNGMEYDYQASSPDEKALVETSRNYGIIFHGMRDDWLEVTFQGELRRFRQVHVLDFDPTRKRMSVIVQEEDGSMYLHVKGAETAIFDRVAEGDVESAERHILDYARLGLRTLCIASKKLTEEEFTNFDKILNEAKRALSLREEKLQEAYDVIERDFRLLGATGVEDRLQDGVPETIMALRDAGIQVWVLTGDKQETAVNISYSAGHFNEDMVQLCLTQKDSAEACSESINAFLSQIADSERLGGKKHALVIDGKSLAFVLGEGTSEEVKASLQELVHVVDTVLCCRMTPIQKARVVKLIKNSPDKPTTASIGDGANDVSMIQEAHVGLGIMGKEGRQAVRSSDYAFGRFRFLRRALLVHGHYFYWRIATLVQYSFYKNVAMITAQLYFTFYSAFSAQTIMEGFFLMFYNVTFTSLPVLVYGLLEQHISQQDLVNYPVLYQRIKRNSRLSGLEFLKWNMLGLWHSLVLFFGCYFAFGPGNAPDSDGKMYGLYDHGAIIMTTCVYITNAKLCLETYYFNGITAFGFLLTAFGYYVLGFIYSAVLWSAFTEEYTFYKSFGVILSSPYVWLVQLVLCMIALIPDIVLRCVTDTFSDVFRQKKIASEVKNYAPNKLSISFTKRSGTLTLSQTNIIED